MFRTTRCLTFIDAATPYGPSPVLCAYEGAAAAVNAGYYLNLTDASDRGPVARVSPLASAPARAVFEAARTALSALGHPDALDTIVDTGDGFDGQLCGEMLRQLCMAEAWAGLEDELSTGVTCGRNDCSELRECICNDYPADY